MLWYGATTNELGAQGRLEGIEEMFTVKYGRFVEIDGVFGSDLRGSSHLPGSTQPRGVPDPQLYST